MRKIILITAITAISSQAMASSIAANFQANAIVNASCSVSATNVALGELTPSQSGTTSKYGFIGATCTNGTSYSLALSTGSSGSFAERKMVGSIAGNTDTLAYNLYTDSANPVVFGDGSEGTQMINLTGMTRSILTRIRVKMPSNQYIKPDTYTDNITVTLTY